jgi:hypothetical protein
MERVAVDTTVQPKAIAHPTDARLMHRALEKLVALAEREGVVADMEKLTGIAAQRIHVDKGYRGHNHPNKFRVWISGQVRRTTAALRRVKAERRMGRNYLRGRDGGRINAVLAAAGYNFGLLLRWFEALLRVFIAALTLAARQLQFA